MCTSDEFIVPLMLTINLPVCPGLYMALSVCMKSEILLLSKVMEVSLINVAPPVPATYNT